MEKSRIVLEDEVNGYVSGDKKLCRQKLNGSKINLTWPQTGWTDQKDWETEIDSTGSTG